jgi:integrase
MGRKASERSALWVSRRDGAGLHFVGGVAGLALQVQPSGASSWVLRAVIGGKRRDMGLGGYPDVTLAGARKAAREAREKIKDGIDPIDQGRAARSALCAAKATAVTFEQAARGYLDGHESSWRNAKHAHQWRTTLETYAYPLIGSILVRDVEVGHVMAVLEPIWKGKTETASRLRGRIEQVLDWATVRGYRQGLNPARWRGHLNKILPRPSRVSKSKHHAALPVGDLPGFMASLRTQRGMGARALEFAILTAARSGEVRGATWTEIDLKAAVWRISDDRMKSRREHRVPLSDPALKLLRALPRMAGSNLVFTAPRGGMLSDMTLAALLRRTETPAVPHGFRSTFRDWCSERTNYPNEVAEMALAHSIGDKVEAAYRRGDLFEKRRRLMNEWAAFCAKVEPKRGRVIPLRRKTA